MPSDRLTGEMLLRKELEDRRVCLEGARGTLRLVAEVLRNARDPDLLRTSLLGPVHDRIVLVGEAISNTDSALSAAATARPDWEAIARELYEALSVAYEEEWEGADGHPTAIRFKAALKAFERAALGEGEGGR